MKKFIKIILVSFTVILVSFTKSNPSSNVNDLGSNIFQALKENDFNKIKLMMVDVNDIENTLDHFEMNDQKRQNVKKSFITKIKDDSLITVNTIEKGFNDIRLKLESKKCKKESSISKITPTTSSIKGLPFELGDLLIEFKCGNNTEEFNVEIIRTETGWYILEKLRLIHK